MATTLTMVYALGLPILGMIVAVTATLLAWSAAREGPRFEPRTKGMRNVFLVLPATLVLFGYATYFLAAAADDVNPAILEASALAYGAPALAVGIGEALVFWRGVPALFKDLTSFGRTTVVATLPEVGALFGYAISFLILGVGHGQIGDPAPAIAASTRAALWVTGSGVATTVGGFLAMSPPEIHTKRAWKRGLLLGVPTLPIGAILFGLAFIEIGSF